MPRLNTYIAHLDITMFIWNVTPITGDLSHRSTPDILVGMKTCCLRNAVAVSVTEEFFRVSIKITDFYIATQISFDTHRMDFHFWNSKTLFY